MTNDQATASPAVVRRIQREIIKVLSKDKDATVLERITAIYRIAQAATEAAIEYSDPMERETNKRIMRETLGVILLETLGPDEIEC